LPVLTKYIPVPLLEDYNLGQNKKEQLTPFPPNDEGAKEQNGILASLK